MKHKNFLLLLCCSVFVLLSGIVCAVEFYGNESEHYSVPRERNPFYSGDTLSSEFFQQAPAALSEGMGYSEDIPYRTTAAKTAADLRAAMVQRENTIVVGLQTDSVHEWVDLAKAIFIQAVAHTGEPKEGDTLAWHWLDRDIAITVDRFGEVRYVTFTYYIHYYTTVDMETELDRGVESLLAELDLETCSDYEKAKAIYDYICKNVEYDNLHASQSSYVLKYTTYAALLHKKAVCQGIALLYYRLACELDLDARVIFGKAGNVNHTWLIVRLGDSYFNLDPTWDLGASSYRYFLKGEQDFPGHKRMDNALCGLYYPSPAFYGAYPVAAWNFVPTSIPEDGISGVCGDGVFWVLSCDGRLVVYGAGTTDDYAEAEAPWNEYAPFIREIVVDRGITGIGCSAFVDCTEVEKVVLPHSSVAIGENAFSETVEVCYPQEKTLLLKEASPCIIAESANGTRYAVMNRLPCDILELGALFDLADTDRIQLVSADGARRFTDLDSVNVGMRVQLLDGDGGVSDELTVALWGDFDFDCAVTEQDAIILLWSFLAPEKYGYAPYYDVNGDGFVNASDAAALAVENGAMKE